MRDRQQKYEQAPHDEEALIYELLSVLCTASRKIDALLQELRKHDVPTVKRWSE